MLVYTVDVPYWDQWDFVPLLTAWLDGNLGWSDLHWQHGEHRPLFARLLLLGLASLSGWSVRWETVANVMVAIGTLTVVGGWLRGRLGAARALPLFPVAAIFLFSPAAWESWLWGWQAQVFLCLLASVACLLVLAAPRPGPLRLAGAWALALVAAFSFAYGLLVLPLGLLLVAAPRPGRWPRTVAWAAGALLVLVLYLSGYTSPEYHPGPGLDPAGLAAAGLFLLALLGAPLFPWSAAGAAVLGAAGLAVLLAVTRRRPADVPPAVQHGLLALAAFAVAAAALIALGRAPFGLEHAMSPRYGSVTLLFWLALALAVALRTGSLRERRLDASGALLAAVLALGVATFAHGSLAVHRFHHHLAEARHALVETDDEALLRRLHPDVELVRERAREVRERQLGPFRPRD